MTVRLRNNGAWTNGYIRLFILTEKIFRYDLLSCIPEGAIKRCDRQQA